MRGWSFLRRMLVPMMITLSAVAGATSPTLAEEVPIDAEHWNLYNAEITTHAGRTCLAGTAAVKDVVFENGVIDVDLWVPRVRTYAGVNFRIQSGAAYERLYIRPHRAPFYPDALQYTPVFGNVAGWQLYSGAGATASLELPYEEWVHFRVEVKGSQARVYMNDMECPVLRIHDLKHGLSQGMLGVAGERGGSAYFSNFHYQATDDLIFAAPAVMDAPPGTITEWEISRGFPLGAVDLERYPDEEMLGPLEWRTVATEANGLLDIARHVPRRGPQPDCVLARTTLTAETDERREFSFGYSDAAVVYLNGEALFSGASAYQQRDPSFLGIIGLFDTLELPLVAGENELLFLIVESFGGWGLMGQDGHEVFRDPHLETLWETPPDLPIPECAVYDPARDLFYVSNYDLYNLGAPPGEHFISTLGRDGKILEREWVTGLRSPLGMVLDGDRLFVAQRAELAEIDVERGEIVGHILLPEGIFPNDVARDPRTGDLYVSDTRRHAIYRVRGGTAEIWLEGPEIDRPNGLLVEGERLYICNGGDFTLKAARLSDGSCTPIARFYGGILDGLQSDGAGNLLMSIWEGRLYRITPSGEVTKLLDTSTQQINCADFLYMPAEGLLLVPTFRGNRVVAYQWRG